MYQAISKSLNMVSPGGLCVLALYRKTKMWGFWKLEKRFYSESSEITQHIIRKLYITLYRLALLVKGDRLKEVIHDYQKKRGMNFFNDVHDWLGGYPYESITPEELKRQVDTFGFKCIRQFNRPAGIGIFGSGNDEFVFQRKN